MVIKQDACGHSRCSRMETLTLLTSWCGATKSLVSLIGSLLGGIRVTGSIPRHGMEIVFGRAGKSYLRSSWMHILQTWRWRRQGKDGGVIFEYK